MSECSIFLYTNILYFPAACLLPSEYESVMQHDQNVYMGRTVDWKQISAMFRLIWLSGVPLSWEIHTDRYRAQVELISSNCGLCCFTPHVLVSSYPLFCRNQPFFVSPSPSVGNWLISSTHTRTPVAPYKQVSWLPLDCFQFSQSPIDLSSAFKDLYEEWCTYKRLTVTALYTGRL